MGRIFSIEMESREHMKNINISEGRDGVLIEGDLGELKGLSLIEGLMLEVKGSNGTLRLELTESDLKQVLQTECES